MWTKEQIEMHKIACDKLEKIKDETFEYIKENKQVSEYEVQQFILKKFKDNGLKTDKDSPIVAFNENTAIPHYFPKENSKILKPNSLILIDIWARLDEKNSPFSDITWMAYYGDKVGEDILKVFNVILRVRDSCIEFIKNNLKEGNMPYGKEIDDFAREIITKEGYGENIMHRTGHSIGFFSPHGKHKHLNEKNLNQLYKNLGYTIEPGIYFKNRFGIRSEINFFVNNNFNMVITTPIQKEIIKI